MFIRTKDGIYEVEKLNLNKIVGNIKYEIIDNKLLKTMYGYESHLYESEIIKQSDTIEELCDGFFIDFISDLEEYKNFISEEKIFNRFGFDDFKEQFNAYRELEGDVYNHCEGYGLIKTSKGLIYVAKMNEEGVLELI